MPAIAKLPQNPERERWIFAGKVPGPLEADRVKVPAGQTPISYSYRLKDQKPLQLAGGQARIVNSSNFPASSTIAAALVEIAPGGMREMHWHPNNDEWQYYLGGKGA